MERVPVRRIDVRRAVLRALLGSDRPLSAAELARGLGIVGDTATGRSGRKVIADLLAYPHTRNDRCLETQPAKHKNGRVLTLHRIVAVTCARAPMIRVPPSRCSRGTGRGGIGASYLVAESPALRRRRPQVSEPE
jgi:hypothetical protein